MIVMLPVTAPDAAGVNVAVNVAVCPASITWLAETPLMLKPVPETLAEEIVTFAVPEFVRVIVRGLFEPTAILPNAMLPGLAVKVELGATPLPESVTV